jgi:hypothetical protein
MKIDLVYIHDENTLKKIGLIDDFTSFVWNNKYYEAGDFEIIVPLNIHNLNLLKRNRFITRPELKEIAIIETVSAYSQNNTEEIKITGTMAQSLLSRRVIWDSVLVNGATIPQLRALINNNLINPKDKRRCIPSGSHEISKVGNYIEKEDIYTAQLQSVSANAYVEQWQQKETPTNTDWYNFKNEQILNLEENVSIETEEPTFSIVLGNMFKNPNTNVIDTIESLGNGEYKKIKRVEKDNTLHTYLFNQVKNGQLEWTTEDYNTMYKIMAVKVKTKFSSSTFFNWFNLKADDDGNISFPVYSWDSMLGSYYEDTRAIVPRATKALEGNGAYLVDFLEVFDPDKSNTLVYSEEYDGDGEATALMAKGLAFQLLGYNVRFCYYSAGVQSFYGYIKDGYGMDLHIPKKIKGYALYDLETPTETLINLSALSKSASVYKLMNNTELSSGLMSFILSYTSSYKAFLNLGVFPKNKATIYEIVDGENLESYVEENLQNMGLGLKARYEESNNQIYLDFYSGNNLIMENGKLRPVIFSKNMDALNGYNITESNKSKYTVVRLKAKDENGNEIKTEVGAGSGITRIEKFTSLNDLSTYSGADYIKSLASKGELFLNGFERVIDAEIFANAYKYREHYNVGDLCTIIVDDFSLRYDIRILGVCESYDTNGYQISLILGA